MTINQPVLKARHTSRNNNITNGFNSNLLAVDGYESYVQQIPKHVNEGYSVNGGEIHSNQGRKKEFRSTPRKNS